METHSVSQKKKRWRRMGLKFWYMYLPDIGTWKKGEVKMSRKERKEITLPGHPNYSLLDPSTSTIIVAQ